MMGPLAYGACRDTAERCIDSAKKAGCKALLGGARPMSPDMADGAFVLPTVFEVSDNKLDLMREEIFAPVVGIMKVSTPKKPSNSLTTAVTACVLPFGQPITARLSG